MNQGFGDDGQPGLVEALWRYRWSSMAIVVVAVGISIGVALMVQPPAQARATIALASPPEDNVLAPGTQGDASLARYTAQRAAFVTSDVVLGAVAAVTGDDVTDLRSKVTATPSGTSNTLSVTVSAESRRAAVELAEAVVEAYRSETEAQIERRTEAAIRAIEESAASASGSRGATTDAAARSATLSQLALRASEIRVSSALLGDGVDFVNAPRRDAVMGRRLPVRDAALGFVVGLVVAATLAWIRADRSRVRAAARGRGSEGVG